MKHQRKFVVKVIDSSGYHWTNQMNIYIERIYKRSVGYNYDYTKNIEHVKIWKYKKSCEKSIEILQNKLEPTKTKNKLFEIIEITDNQTLRNIKLKKINGKTI